MVHKDFYDKIYQKREPNEVKENRNISEEPPIGFEQNFKDRKFPMRRDVAFTVCQNPDPSFTDSIKLISHKF